MKKNIDPVLRVLLSLLLITPILGALKVFPGPTRNLYNTDQAFNFIQTIMGTYLIYGIAVACVITILCLWTKRTALAALVILPITVCIVGFHMFLDGGLFTGGAIMGNILLVLNLYFLWQNRKEYERLLKIKM